MSYSSSVQGVGLLLSLGGSILPGCTDPAAFNYNPAATLNDNSCIAVVLGCTEPTAFNYDAIANVDSSFCAWAGCIDPLAFNYNSVIVANANTYGTTATNDGTCIAIVNGCTDPLAFNYNSSANTNDGSCIAVVNGCTNPSASNYNALANIDDGSCIAVVNGCVDVTACNYDALANTDDGSCTYASANANCAGNCLTGYTSVGGACVAIVNGCTDPVSFNYNPIANIDDSSCIAVVLGCTDTTANNYDSTANTDDGSCTYTTCSGTAPITGNYATTNTNDATISWDNMNTGLCTVDWYQIRYKVSGASVWTNLPITTTNSQNIPNLIPATTYEYGMKIKYVGSASAVAWFYNPSGTFITSSCPSGTIELYGQCVPAIYGCTNPYACNSNGFANVDDGSCTYPAANADCFGCLSGYTLVNGACVSIVYGCTDSTQFGYSALANVDDGSCTPIVLGCINPAATNYNTAANTDNGSCTFPQVVVGCMDSTACNYNAAATTTGFYTNKTLCVYPIPNATITIGGTDANYGPTGPAYFNTGSPTANTAKFVKHIVNPTGWPLTSVQQHDMGLSFRWGEPGADMSSSFLIWYQSTVEKITVKLLKQFDPTDAASSWDDVYTEDYNIPDWSNLDNQIGKRNYGGNTNTAPYSYPESFGTGQQNSFSNYNFAVYYNAHVKNKYRVEITQAHMNPTSSVLETWGGYSGIQSPVGNVNCGGRFEFEIQDLPCSSMDPNLVIYGCTAPTACNYNSLANCDDSSCYYGISSPVWQCNSAFGPLLSGCYQCVLGTCGNAQVCDSNYPTYQSQADCISACGNA
jgi:hypothetical protein